MILHIQRVGYVDQHMFTACNFQLLVLFCTKFRVLLLVLLEIANFCLQRCFFYFKLQCPDKAVMCRSNCSLPIPPSIPRDITFLGHVPPYFITFQFGQNSNFRPFLAKYGIKTIIQPFFAKFSPVPPSNIPPLRASDPGDTWGDGQRWV